MNESERTSVVDSVMLVIGEEVSRKDSTLIGIVDAYYGGNEFWLSVYRDYNDVASGFAPPSSVGKFGWDTDNWVWPRHTGDFAVFRIYAGKDNRPADSFRFAGKARGEESLARVRAADEIDVFAFCVRALVGNRLKVGGGFLHKAFRAGEEEGIVDFVERAQRKLHAVRARFYRELFHAAAEAVPGFARIAAYRAVRRRIQLVAVAAFYYFVRERA